LILLIFFMTPVRFPAMIKCFPSAEEALINESLRVPSVNAESMLPSMKVVGIFVGIRAPVVGNTDCYPTTTAARRPLALTRGAKPCAVCLDQRSRSATLPRERMTAQYC